MLLVTLVIKLDLARAKVAEGVEVCEGRAGEIAEAVCSYLDLECAI